MLVMCTSARFFFLSELFFCHIDKTLWEVGNRDKQKGKKNPLNSNGLNFCAFQTFKNAYNLIHIYIVHYISIQWIDKISIFPLK